jgi:TRAP-type mannitol/chloroaromatic compound transport system permease large subunit
MGGAGAIVFADMHRRLSSRLLKESMIGTTRITAMLRSS